ncbi:TlpA disulfide reductase family protein [Ramlibacter sp. 2FC]|uniref:TlpA family protein disulfide reductase n=1 Tax=Ramlibacter sp. 2FC TaxID=2502188 RepID=UPI0010F59513|nr:TlpA disulfide reductase family protein [Ramlibacter sp. 2FC]
MKDTDHASSAPRPGRRSLFAGVAAAAALAGAGLAWWRLRPQAMETEAEAALWQRRFARPEGGELVLQSLRGRPLLINFWATWCPPCVEELPLLDRFYREHAARGWQVVGLAVDQLAPVQGFLRKLPLSFPIGLAGFEGAELARSLGNTTGGLPFTVVLGAQGQVLQRKIGQVSPQDLQQWATHS